MKPRGLLRRAGAPRRNAQRAPYFLLLATAAAACAPYQFHNPDPHAFDQFGWAVAVDGDWAIVSVPKNDSLNSNGGIARIYQRDGTTWPLRATIAPSTPSHEAQFGWSVDIEGDRAIVGAFLDASIGFISGAAYIFERSGNEWTETGKLFVDTISESGYAKSVAISGDYAVVGAPFAPPPTFAGPGVAWVYRRNAGGQWLFSRLLSASDAVDFIEFGTSVDIDGDVIVVGAEQGVAANTVAGAAYVFRRQGNNWNEEAKLTASDPAYHDRFGAAVSVSGNRIVVGAPEDDGEADGAGAAYVFLRNATTGDWAETQKLTADDATAGDNFGYSVSVDDGRVLVGAWLANGSANTTGAAYLFRTAGASWELARKLQLSSGEYGDGYGASVSISGSCGVVGAVNRDAGDLEKAGGAYYYCGLPGPTLPTLEIDIICCVDIPDPLGPVVTTTRLVNYGEVRIVGRRWIEAVGRDGRVQVVAAPESIVLGGGETVEQRHVLGIRRADVVALRVRFDTRDGVHGAEAAIR